MIIKNTKFLYGALLILSLFPFFYRLGDRPLRNPDEGRYAEIAREMVLNNDWLEPTLYGIDYLRKPILFYWLTSVSFKFLGFSEFSARLVPALFGWLGILMTYFFVRKVSSSRDAVFSAVLLAANIWYVQISRYLLIDAVFSFFLVGAFYLFYLAANGSGRLYYLFYVFLALSFLTKGLAALVIMGFCLIPYLFYTRQIKSAWLRMRPFKGALIFLAICLPWFIAISFHEPEFLKFFFVHEHFKRFASSHFEHQEPFYYYLLALPVIFIPWVFFLNPAGNMLSRIKNSSKNSLESYLTFCAFGTLFFYSLSKSKLPTYILPCIPLLSVLAARAWANMRALASENRALFHITRIIFPLLAITAVVFSFLVHKSLFKKIPAEAKEPVLIITGIVFVFAWVWLYWVQKQDWNRAFYSVAVCVALAFTPIAWTMEAVNSEYTTRHFADTLKPRLSPDDRVFIYDHPGAFYDFAFYLNHKVLLVGLEGELELARGDYEEKENSVRHDEFDQLLLKNEKLYCLMRKSDFENMNPDLKSKLFVVQEDKRKVLLGTLPNKPLWQ